LRVRLITPCRVIINMDEDNRTFGAIVKEKRLEKLQGNGGPNPDFSLRRFAKRIGISPTLLSQVENEAFPPPRAETVASIADALGLDRESLLTKANRIDPNLQRIVIKKQEILASFLRTVDNMSSEELQKILDKAQEGDDGNGRQNG